MSARRGQRGGSEGRRLRREYRRHLAGHGFPVSAPCVHCGGRLEWQPAGMLCEVLDSAGMAGAASELVGELLRVGGDLNSVVTMCFGCRVVAIWAPDDRRMAG